MNRACSVVLVSLLCAAGCSKEPAATERPPAAQEEQKPAIALPSFQGAFTEQAALFLLLKDVETPRWDETVGHLSFKKDDTEHYAAGIGQFPFRQQGSERLLFVFESNAIAGNDCHACGPTIGAAVFSHEGETWRIETAQTEVTAYLRWGESADGAVSFNRLGPDRYGISVYKTDLHFGVIDTGVQLFEVTPGFPQVFSVLLAENNEGNCTEDIEQRQEEPDQVLHPCYDFSGHLSFVPGKNAEYDDLEVRFRGTHVTGEDEKLESFSESARYVYRDGQYVQVEER